MPDSYDLTQLEPNAFEHLVNHLALRVLGSGLTGFSPGSDGGRDGYFEGRAAYPSEMDCWSGCWYIQSKFHKPHLSKDPQKWLLTQIKEELTAFRHPEFRRNLPNNWIIATNIDPSGTPETGAFDKARELVSKECPELQSNFHIWGGRKILDLLALYPSVSEYYQHFLTPGQVLAEIYNQIKDSQAEVDTILRFLLLSQLDEQQNTKLEQAGAVLDERPGIHDFFIDLPFRCTDYNIQGLAVQWLARNAAKCHRIDEEQPDTKEWQLWNKHPSRSKVWFIKGGPGHGKSTISQFFCQIQRSAWVLSKDIPGKISTKQRKLANEIKQVAEKRGFWTSVPRIPISIELKEFAQWFGQREKNSPRGILTYLAEFISACVEQEVKVGVLRRLLGTRRWIVVFDGLDEVPQDVKDSVALEVCRFVNDITVELDSDILTICTSRPQGYSGQFEDLDGSTIELTSLSQQQALDCAEPVIKLGRSQSEVKKSIQILKSAIESPAVYELMTTPLQSHIMAVVVRDGEIPPERKWKLFTNFYQVIKKREANRNLPDKRLAKLLREDEQLLKTIHNRLGFVLHARAESSQGAQTKLDREEFKKLATDAVSQMVETEVDATIDVLMKATTDRLVLVSTPDDGNNVRFDIRPLQEFFAAEFLYESVNAEELRERVELIAGDAHWREVLHFLLSALIENGRGTELAVVIEVLENLNEGDEDELQLLRRRIARGAILAAKLLQEGVLGQDKRIRQQFRKCLEPLAASTEIEILQPLMQVDHIDSFAWLSNFLLSCLRDKHPSANIGAAIVLVQLLPDGSDKTEEVSNFLLSSSPDYLSCVLSLVITRRDFILQGRGIPEKNLKKWFLKTVIKLVLNPKCFSLQAESLSLCLEYFNFSIKNTYSIFKELGFSEVDLSLFQILIEEGKHAAYSSYNNPSLITKSTKDYGFVKLVHKCTNLADKVGEIELSENLYSTPIILRLVYFAVCFRKRESRLELINILNILVDVGEHLINRLLNILGIPLPTFLTIKNQSVPKPIEYLNYITDSEFQEISENQKPRFSFLNGTHIIHQYRDKEIFKLDSWIKLLSDSPEVAVYLWGDDEIFQFSKDNLDESVKKEIVISLVKSIISKPEIIQDFPALWGRLLNEAPKYRNELRQTFLLASSNSITDNYSSFRAFRFRFVPFKVISEKKFTDAGKI